MTANLATFVDRYTMKHVRIYAHPIDLVWDAITNDEDVSAWMGFPVHLELRVGGTCTWGAENSYFTTHIVRLEPPTLIEHNGLRFELSPHPDGCKLEFTQWFEQGQWEEWPHDLGGDLPGGTDTPWRPGFVGGFHSALDGLAKVLDGQDPWDGIEPGDDIFGRIVDEWAKQSVEQRAMPPEDAARYARELRVTAHWNDLNEIYRKHIRDTIPAE